MNNQTTMTTAVNTARTVYPKEPIPTYNDWALYIRRECDKINIGSISKPVQRIEHQPSIYA